MVKEKIENSDEKMEEVVEEELSPEEAAKKMEEIVEAEEEKREEVERKEIAKDMEKADKEVRKEREDPYERDIREGLANWVPKTQLGKEVLQGKIKNIDEIFETGKKIMEPQIVDSLIKLKVEMLDIGQSKGKFGGGKRRAYRQTQKKTMEGNVLTFSAMAVVGDGKGHIGWGVGKAAETLPAKEKAIRKAKLNLRKIKRGCASFDCSCDELHSIPMETEGKCGSVKIRLLPAPQGTGLVVGDQVKKILQLAGIKDVYSKTKGKTRTVFNVGKAVFEALDKLGKVKL